MYCREMKDAVMRWGCICLGCAVLFTAIAPGHADDADDAKRRESIRGDISKRLASMLDLLRDVVSSSSGEDRVERSRTEADAVKTLALSLRQLKNNDSTTTQVADRYPDYADRFREAATALKQLRHDQNVVDDLSRLCEERERDLQDKIRPFVDRNNPAGVDEIPKLAQQIGRPVFERLLDAERKRSELQEQATQPLTNVMPGAESKP